jgi:DNA polymerase-1
MITAHAINERRSVALKNVGKELFGASAADLQTDVKKWLSEERRRRSKEASASGEEIVEPNFSDVPMEIMEPYALEDVILTRKVCDTYEPIVAQQPDIARTVKFERKTMDALYAIEKRGLPADEIGYRELELEVSRNLESLEGRVEDLAAEAGVKDFNWRSTPQIIDALKARGADLSYMSEKNGKLSADADNLRAVNDEMASALLKLRSEYKVLSTYVRPMLERHHDTSIRAYKEPFISEVDQRIHANYRQVGARTGRMSCSDPNIQNQPRDDLRLRYNITAEEGYKLVTCDLSNIEMVLFAAYAGEGRLKEALQAGEDLHALTAKMLGLRDRKREGGGVETARQLGKTYNFSRIYGGGLRTIKRSFRCSMDEARLLKRRFDDAYPEVSRLSSRIEVKLQEEGYVRDSIISGRRFRVDPRDAYKATNYLVQGTAASVLKEAAIKLHADGVPMVGLVHDEIIAHVPEADAAEAKNLIIQRLTENEELKKVVPLKAEGAIVDRWSDAKPLKDEKGRLYLFTPEWDGGERRELYYGA